MQKTHNLGLPLLEQGQLNKDITLNSSLFLIDCMINSALETLTKFKIPPKDLEDGKLILTSHNAEDSFLDFPNHIAFYQNGWNFVKPNEGLILWVKDLKQCVVFNGSNFIKLNGSNIDGEIINTNTDNSSSIQALNDEIEDLKNRIKSLENPSKIGINASADENNKLTVRSNYSLFNSEAEDVRIVLNKKDTENTASFIFQSNWNGVAEFGSIYGDNFILKVSNNGEWKEVFEVNSQDGSINFKQDILKNGSKIF